MKEASELMEKMKSMPGMKNMNQILSKMGLPMGGKNQKVSMNAFQSHMKQNMKKASQRERMLRKLEQRKKERELKAMQTNSNENIQYTHSVFKASNESIQKTTRQDVEKKKRKKKRKRKKTKK